LFFIFSFKSLEELFACLAKSPYILFISGEISDFNSSIYFLILSLIKLIGSFANLVKSSSEICISFLKPKKSLISLILYCPFLF